MAKVLILHGWTNRRIQGNWHRHLATELRKQGHIVVYPQFPNTDHPVLEEWQELLEAELSQLAEIEAQETVVVGHSLGCVNWVQAAATGKIETPVDRVLFVAPADPRLLGEIDGLRVSLDDAEVASATLASAKSLTVLASEKDKWLPRGVQITYGEPLGLDPVILEGAGHLSLDDGFGYWQGVIDWVNDPKADLKKR
jgi:predicted alpha/beta hydrolase family esterase